MNPKVQDPQPPQNADQVNESLYVAVKDEIQHEVAHIVDNKQPVDTTQSDVLVQKHFSGLFITLLVVVVIILVIAIAGIALYPHH